MGMRHIVTTAVPVSRVQDRRQSYTRNDSRRIADRARPFADSKAFKYHHSHIFLADISANPSVVSYLTRIGKGHHFGSAVDHCVDRGDMRICLGSQFFGSVYPGGRVILQIRRVQDYTM